MSTLEKKRMPRDLLPANFYDTKKEEDLKFKPTENQTATEHFEPNVPMTQLFDEKEVRNFRRAFLHK